MHFKACRRTNIYQCVSFREREKVWIHRTYMNGTSEFCFVVLACFWYSCLTGRKQPLFIKTRKRIAKFTRLVVDVLTGLECRLCEYPKSKTCFLCVCFFNVTSFEGFEHGFIAIMQSGILWNIIHDTFLLFVVCWQKNVK